MRKHIADNRENPQLTTITRCKLSGPLEHKLKRTDVVEWLGGRRKRVETIQRNIKAEIGHRLKRLN